MMKMQSFIIVLLLLVIRTSKAFLLGKPSSHRSLILAPLFGIAEWRASSLETNRTLLLLPLPVEEALLPGQSRTIVLNEGRYFDMLDEATEDHCSVIGTILRGHDDLLPVIPLCEISSYSLEAGYRGKPSASVTLNCVGRVSLPEPAAASLTQFKPYMIGRCHQLLDDEPCDLDSAFTVVNDIEEQIEIMTETKQFMYQKNFWLALSALGYMPTSLLKRGPSTSNRRKEIEAVSWAVFSILEDKTKLYSALAITNLMERLQFALQASLEDTFFARDIATINFESVFE